MHVISMDSFGDQNPIEEVLESARRMIPWARRNTCEKQFPLHKAALLFLERSTRTAGSTEQAVQNLGMRYTMVQGVDHTSILKGESFADTFRMFVGQGARIIALRTKIEGAPLHAAKITQQYIGETSMINPGPVSIINCGDGRQWHPTQTVLDMLTIQEKLGRLDNFTLGITNDPKNGRTAHSLLSAFARRKGMKFVIVAPKGFEMPANYKLGIANIVESDSLEALAECDVVYVTRFQEERMTPAERLFIDSVRRNFIINRKVLDSWNPGIHIMHPLPRVDEIDSEISLDKRVVAFQQAELGIPARMALIAMLCEKPFVPFVLKPEPKELLSDSQERNITDRQKPLKHFQPISFGTVIDHIPAGQVELVFQILKTLNSLPEGLPRQAVQFVNSGRYPDGKKDVLLLHGCELPELAAATIQAIFPQATINHLPGNDTIIKKRFHVPVGITENVQCSNEVCITRVDQEAKPNFIFIGNEGESHQVVCEYCGYPLWS